MSQGIAQSRLFLPMMEADECIGRASRVQLNNPKLPALDSSLDLESLLADNVSHRNLTRFLKIVSDQKRSLDQSLEAALSESKRELTAPTARN